ncbi:MAG: aminoglycoside 6-adenylyltransferase [Bacteroidota bacterium]
MRTEQEMLQLILDTAQCDDRIRAVVMNGSRANPNAPHDFFQDFDIVYFVTDVAPFRKNLDWIKRFGELMILQMPDEMGDPAPLDLDGFAYLMQFADGNRIDLGIYPLESIQKRTDDSLSVVLLDKDGTVEPLPPASDSGYLPRPPSARQFADCCNEFWWCSPYVAKGLWRQEFPYARYMLEVVREELMKMLAWHIGVKTGFRQNPGKFGKYFQKHLEPESWKMLQRTYADSSYEHTWEALFVMGELFRKTAMSIAEQYGFEYPLDDDRRVTAHLEHVRGLPRHAQEMY